MVLEERIESLKLSEQRGLSALSDARARAAEQDVSRRARRRRLFARGIQHSGAMTLRAQAAIKELTSSLQALSAELRNEKCNHQMTQLRAEKQEEWSRREAAQLQDEVAEGRRMMEGMIPKELHRRDLEGLRAQGQAALVRRSRSVARPHPRRLPAVGGGRRAPKRRTRAMRKR